MAVVDELITRIGFEVVGANKLTKVEGRVKKFRAEMGKWRTAFKTGLSHTTALISSMGSFAARIALVTAAVGVLAAALIGPLVAGLTAVGIKSAKARRELQITAKSTGTTAQNLDTLSNFFNIFDVGIDKAREWSKETAKSIDEVVQAAKDGDTEARDKLKKSGLAAFDTGRKDKNGKPVYTTDPTRGKARDSSILSAEATHNAEAYRRMAEAAEAKGNRKQAQAYREKSKAAFEITGLDKDAQARIKEGPAPNQYADEAKKQTELRPTRSDEQDERAKRIAEKWAKVENNLGAIMDGVAFKFFMVGEVVADYVVPALLTFTDWLVKAAKFLGLIPETDANKKAREAAEVKADAEIRKDNPELADYLKKRDYSTGILDPDILDPSKRKKEEPKTAYEKVREEQDSGGGAGLPDLDKLMRILDPATQIQKAQSSADQKTTQSNMTNVGNDQRQMPITVNNHVNAVGLDGIAAAASQGIKSGLAASLSKQNNTSTATVPKP